MKEQKPPAALHALSEFFMSMLQLHMHFCQFSMIPFSLPSRFSSETHGGEEDVQTEHDRDVADDGIQASPCEDRSNMLPPIKHAVKIKDSREGSLKAAYIIKNTIKK